MILNFEKGPKIWRNFSLFKRKTFDKLQIILPLFNFFVTCTISYYTCCFQNKKKKPSMCGLVVLVIDYVNLVSAQLLTTLTPCLRCQRLRESVYLLTAWTPCCHSQQLLGYHVGTVNNYLDNGSAQSTTTQIPCRHSQRLLRFHVGIVNDNADTLLWRVF